ncbi:hypothetical protein [Nocardia sp. AG03]|uniref:hypothetical protein n=1 Tax=Nocardia sp. AG03 TaxID=3025312 RepID=UPI00241899E3|nr:hypothetical protein [Nocardia sp. AG03]
MNNRPERARRAVAARLAAGMDQWRALVAEGVAAAERWSNGIARLEDWVNSNDKPAPGNPDDFADNGRHYFADRRRALAVWTHVLGASDPDERAGLESVVAEAAEQGRVVELLAEVCATALRMSPALPEHLAGVAEELLEAAYSEVAERQANADGWDIDPERGSGGE